MQLKELASRLTASRISGDGSINITGIQIDSRKVKPGDLFVCVSEKIGIKDRHLFAEQAVSNGASALVVEYDVESDVPKLFVKNTWDALSILSCHFYEYPSNSMKVIGITGTNGKTTSSYLLEKILSHNGFVTGLMGNIHVKIGSDYIINHENNTQDAHNLQRNFRKMVEQGTDYCIIEVSSHGLDMGRVKGTKFRTGIFTNLTQDHLNYHGSMENYKAAKGLLFSRLGNEYVSDPDEQRFAVLNADDPASVDYARLTAAQIVTYGITNEADVRADMIKMNSKGTSFRCTTFRGTLDFQTHLIGEFNVYNSLAAITAALLEGITLESIKESLESIGSVEGRMEVVDEGQDFLVLVDYAHTPDGLDNALSTIKQFAEGQIHCVFGCGGDRDRTKRPVMGAVTARYSNHLYVTSDNPRMEDPQRIVEDIEPGIVSAGFSKDSYELIVDRKAAIKKAIAAASPKDVVLIAGKGHETYQDIQGIKHDFDDRSVAKEAIRGRYRD
ncbi:UDP-N-acetylmuramoyl-L-alanyl-D-glutamate--2,6-diaminopimelate ligase [Paenibacillus radicis (ex Xue et al. 2023)]|uniref:UDP-N-acetylmuramoyl-L-alanyl-D-glutamate--2,6-diaminopimelate ligase n=1 Tax=Paenibacillus radicis (ex Xue et al. 2023) TaxID=2972489 RepID=A0ABT1YP63_9BACL|nr:UDP-N-acetylmuramoyl-L-alanyl-D-glutamate--2,6-diaminopimelate ligase [Paenibacillus radicis (ex Xue et al. 2023)]MCR8634968.1 UDP-N-acetylmuramoyl-L-alanyl-D-glutamate--2,6-diaminopimelate ligase [Paenibacillus radicis (ex Xue et al. 2023)]